MHTRTRLHAHTHAFVEAYMTIHVHAYKHAQRICVLLQIQTKPNTEKGPMQLAAITR